VIAGELTIGGLVRRFTLRPPRAAAGELPLVLVLHGNHPEASGAQMREWTSFDDQSDAYGFAVAYPDGHGGCWADGRGVTTLSLTETAEFWRTTDRCPPGPGETQTTEFSSRVTATGGLAGTQVVSWTVSGGGHTWPGSEPYPGMEQLTSQEFDAAAEICRFARPLLTPAAARRLGDASR
jgi:poly(3-hydroxybutyrate) depolymerase